MSDIECWNIEGDSQVDRTAVVVSGPMVLHGHQILMVRASEYDALAEQLQGAVEERDELRRVLANLREHAINDGAMEAGGGYDVTVLQPLLGGQ
jgi:hypothetical protein